MKKTIIEAIKEVMRTAGHPLTIAEVYNAIIAADLYEFKADKPMHIVQSQLRRHCQGLDFASASDTKHFELHNGKYYLLGKVASLPTPQPPLQAPPRKKPLVELERLHGEYVEDFRRRVLCELQQLDPFAFERFCRNLLIAYGFEQVKTTPKSKDGGIDGHGVFKAGAMNLRAAFQCKRYTSKTVGTPEVNEFIGSIQGDYALGFFFTTARFSAATKKTQSRKGVVPVFLIDGVEIVDTMIKHQIGVAIEHLPIYKLALDDAVTNDNSSNAGAA